MGNFATVAPAPQHMHALQQANRIRLARAELKRKIAAQEMNAADVIMRCPDEAAGMSISDVLMSQRRWGRARCRRLLLSVGLVENKEMGKLTQRQRLELASVLSARASSPAPAATTTRMSEPALSSV